MKLTQKKDEYKFKLIHTQELLAKEKIDNENNLLALKKVLSRCFYCLIHKFNYVLAK